MSTNLVETKTQRGFGRSDTATLEQMFPANPLPTYDPKALLQSCLDGTATGNSDFGPVNMDFIESPNHEDPEGLVDDPFWSQPNLSSPPSGVNPSDKPAPPASQPLPASGWGSSTAPSETAAKISKQRIGELIYGSSDPA